MTKFYRCVKPGPIMRHAVRNQPAVSLNSRSIIFNKTATEWYHLDKFVRVDIFKGVDIQELRFKFYLNHHPQLYTLSHQGKTLLVFTRVVPTYEIAEGVYILKEAPNGWYVVDLNKPIIKRG